MKNIQHPSDLAQQSKEAFMTVFSALYEHSPWVAENAFERVEESDKYNDLTDFHQLLAEIVLKAKYQQQEALIQAHPQLVCHKKTENKLTQFSQLEQKSAGLKNCTEAEMIQFNELNQRYRNQFSLPFIMAVVGKSKQQILENFKTRFDNEVDQERQTALAEINKIAWIRIKNIYET